MSNQTRRLQIRFFIGIIIQTFVPILLVLIPFTIFLTKGPEYNQTKNNIVMIFYVAHNGAANFVILIVHQPYRTFLKSFFISEVRNASFL